MFDSQEMVIQKEREITDYFVHSLTRAAILVLSCRYLILQGKVKSK